MKKFYKLVIVVAVGLISSLGLFWSGMGGTG